MNFKITQVVAMVMVWTAVCASASAAATEKDAVRERFLNPPNRFRALPIVHDIPIKEEAQDKLFDRLSSRGCGGVVTNVPFENYLRDEGKWKLFRRFVDEAKRRGLAMWLYDEKGYPSGTAGGLTLEGHPEWEARGILAADVVSKGGAVMMDVPPGRVVRAAAFPVREGSMDLDRAVDLAGAVQDRKLQWSAPAGEWRVMVLTEGRLYEGTHADSNLSEHQPYPNILLAGPGKRFAELTYDGYAGAVGPDLGKYFIGTFIDEPSLMSLFLRPQPHKVLPWSQTFAADFKARRGYNIEPLLPALVAPAGPGTARARYDFWLTVAELTCENFFQPIRDICRKYKVQSGGHLLLEEPLLCHVPLYGDLFRCERMMDAPSLDCLSSNPPEVHWYSAKLISSAGEMIGRADNMCETSDHQQRWRPQGDTRPVIEISEQQVRGTCNRLIVSGITCITSYYSLDTRPDDQWVRLNQWIGRCCGMLYGGRQATDIAVLYPIESVWTQFQPSRHWNNEAPESAQQIERAYRKASDALFFNQRDFTFVDAQALTEATPADGALRFRDHAWRVVVLPRADTLPQAAWDKLAAFWRSGGVVICIGALPANTEREFPSAQVQAMAKEMFGDGAADKPRQQANPAGGVGLYLPDRDVTKLPAVLDGLLDADVKVAQANSPIRVTHRSIAGQEIFFLINDSDKAWEGEASLAAEGIGEQYDPASGAITPLASAERISLKLEAYGGALFRFDRAKAAQRRPLGGGGIPGFE